MTAKRLLKSGAIVLLITSLAACGGQRGFGNGVFSDRGKAKTTSGTQTRSVREEAPKRDTIWDLFTDQGDPNTTVQVNKYIWNASLDVLNFLPIQAADPFSGVIVTGYGTPPGGGRAYRATIFVRDPALDARSLNLSLQTRSGSVSRETVQAVEDAILTRARQLRVADSRL